MLGYPDSSRTSCRSINAEMAQTYVSPIWKCGNLCTMQTAVIFYIRLFDTAIYGLKIRSDLLIFLSCPFLPETFQPLAPSQSLFSRKLGSSSGDILYTCICEFWILFCPHFFQSSVCPLQGLVHLLKPWKLRLPLLLKIEILLANLSVPSFQICL